MVTRSRGFTLVELVVAIGVIMLLVGLTLSVGVRVIEASERRSTQAALALLDQAVKEWELAAQRKLSWYNLGDSWDTDLADVHWYTDEVLIITEILAVISRNEQVRSVVAGIDLDLVYRYRAGEYPSWIDTNYERLQMDDFDGELTVLDAWGRPIYATHPGGPAEPGETEVDPDGTIRTPNEKKYGVAPNRQVVFVSAGPDGRFGIDTEFLHLMGEAKDHAQDQAKRDNLYSVPVVFGER